MRHCIGLKFQQMNQKLNMLSAKLNSASPKVRFENQRIYLDSLQDKLIQEMTQKIGNCRHQYELLLTRLNGLSPTAKLVGGYGYIEHENGYAIKSVKDVKEQDVFSVTVWDGTIEGVVTKIDEKTERNNG